MDICKALEDLERYAKAEGRIQGIAEGRAHMILDILSDYGNVSDNIKNKVLSEKNFEVLGRWGRLAARVCSVEEFCVRM